jgi:hydroxyacid-oxoacid transhydrogenase
MAYPVAGRVRDFRPAGYLTEHALVPHGFSVVLNAPSVFRFTAPMSSQRHIEAAQALGADPSRYRLEDAGRLLAGRITWFMERLQCPNGLRAVGYRSDDIPALVEGTLLQTRLTTLSPRPATGDDLAALFADAMLAW